MNSEPDRPVRSIACCVGSKVVTSVVVDFQDRLWFVDTSKYQADHQLANSKPKQQTREKKRRLVGSSDRKHWR